MRQTSVSPNTEEAESKMLEHSNSLLQNPEPLSLLLLSNHLPPPPDD